MLACTARRFPGQHPLLIGLFLSKVLARFVSETLLVGVLVRVFVSLPSGVKNGEGRGLPPLTK
jgi:hypothetical protein